MPPKRKANHTTPTQSPIAKKRATRANGPLVDTQPLEDGDGKSTGLNGGYWGSPLKVAAIPKKLEKEGSLKENEARSSTANGSSYDDSIDELLLSPSKPSPAARLRTGTASATTSVRRTRDLVVEGSIAGTTSKASIPARTYGKSARKSVAIPTVHDSDDDLGSYAPPEGLMQPVAQSSTAIVTPRRRGRHSVPSPSDEDDGDPVPAPALFIGQKDRSFKEDTAEESDDDAELPPPPSPSKRARQSTAKASSAASTIRKLAKATLSSMEEKSAPGNKADPVSQLSPRKQPAAETPIPPMSPTSKTKKHATVVVEGASSPLPFPQVTPAKPALAKSTATPSNRRGAMSAPSSPSKLPRILPEHLHPHLHAQKRKMLHALQNPLGVLADVEEDAEPTTNELAYEQLTGLLKGTTERGEGNSCMLVGPRGSGKTAMVERVLCEHQRVAEHAGRAEPIIIRLSGHVQYTDRLAMREIARQLVQQTGDGGAFLDPTAEDDEEPAEEDIAPIVVDEEENPFLDKWSVGSSKQPEVNVRLPPTAHLPSLVSMLPALGRPVILVLDAFDLFALHARQALLYCLLDTVQHSQAGANGAHFTTINATPGKKGKEKQELAWSGLAVVGVTTRVDTLELLEKRVKSRFSGRMIRTTGPAGWGQWERIVRGVLCPERITESGGKAEEAWRVLWEGAVETFLNGKATREALRETVALVQDVHLMTQILMAVVLALNPENPWPTYSLLQQAIKAQRCPTRFATLYTLHYPAVCLLIAATHERTAGHEVVTFEQLHDVFQNQVRKSQAAPVQVEGGGIGMVRCGRGVMMGAFEQLIAARIFVSASGPSLGVGREFIKYRCVPEREDVKAAVEKMGMTNLRKWFTKAI